MGTIHIIMTKWGHNFVSGSGRGVGGDWYETVRTEGIHVRTRSVRTAHAHPDDATAQRPRCLITVGMTYGAVHGNRTRAVSVARSESVWWVRMVRYAFTVEEHARVRSFATSYVCRVGSRAVRHANSPSVTRGGWVGSHWVGCA